MENVKTIYQDLSEERKKLQSEGLLPNWLTTSAWQMLKEKYTTEEHPDLYSIYKRVSATAAKHLPLELREEYEHKFFNLMYNGWLALSTPVLSNMGTDRGCSVSCSGNYVGDDVYDFFMGSHKRSQRDKDYILAKPYVKVYLGYYMVYFMFL